MCMLFTKRVEKTCFLLKEIAVFDTFFAKVRYLPYNEKNVSKTAISLSKKHVFFDPFCEQHTHKQLKLRQDTS